MCHDIKRRAPFYVSDWTEGFQVRNLERVVGATIKMFFLKYDSRGVSTCAERQSLTRMHSITAFSQLWPT